MTYWLTTNSNNANKFNSSNGNVFNKAKIEYETALKNFGIFYKLTNTQNKNKKGI